MCFTTADVYLIMCSSMSMKYEADHFPKMFPDKKGFGGEKHPGKWQQWHQWHVQVVVDHKLPTQLQSDLKLKSGTYFWSVSLTHQDFVFC